jgi:hypothetical protein
MYVAGKRTVYERIKSTSTHEEQGIDQVGYEVLIVDQQRLVDIGHAELNCEDDVGGGLLVDTVSDCSHILGPVLSQQLNMLGREGELRAALVTAEHTAADPGCHASAGTPELLCLIQAVRQTKRQSAGRAADLVLAAGLAGHFRQEGQKRR